MDTALNLDSAINADVIMVILEPIASAVNQYFNTCHPFIMLLADNITEMIWLSIVWVEIDVCEKAKCTDLCIKTPNGGFRCGCRNKGHVLLSDGISCAGRVNTILRLSYTTYYLVDPCCFLWSNVVFVGC